MISVPLNTYIRQGADDGGLRASAGSWYLRMMAGPPVCLTVFASAASLPVGAKFGFCFSGGGSSPFAMASSLLNASA